MPPFVNSVDPKSGDPGDRFSVEISGDVFSQVTRCNFGSEINVERFRIVDDGTIFAKIAIANDARSGTWDVILTDPSGDGTHNDGFEIL